MLTENKFSKYLLYAIGEIVLVIIGILIALSLNQRSKNSMTLAKIEATFDIILDDLSTEIMESERHLIYHQELDSLSVLILKNQLTQQDYIKQENVPGLAEMTIYFSMFKFTQNGYPSLIQNLDAVPAKYDAIVRNLGTLNNVNKVSVTWWNNEFGRISSKNSNHLVDNTTWYSNLSMLSDEIDYRLNNAHYKNTVKHIREMRLNWIYHIYDYRNRAIDCYNEIAKLQDKEPLRLNNAIDQELAKQLKGEWRPTSNSEAQNFILTIENGRVFYSFSYDETEKFEDAIISIKKSDLKTTYNLYGYPLEFMSVEIEGDTLRQMSDGISTTYIREK